MKFRLPRSLNSAVQEGMRVMRDPRLLAWALFVLFFPFYVVPNGLPQPSAWMFILLMPSTILYWLSRDRRMTAGMRSALRALVRFIIYAFAVNAIWTLIVMKVGIDLKDSFTLSPFFYIFNGLLFFTILLLARRYGLYFLWLTTRCVILGVALEVVISFVLRGDHGLRSIGTFNEPNQLGYFALLSACILLLAQK